MTRDHAEIYAPEFGRRHLSNHFPMVSFALKKLGADQSTLEDLNRNNLQSLKLNADNHDSLVISESNFEQYLGKRQAYMGYHAYFRGKIITGKELPRIDDLAKGISAAAFHALIRAGYGIDANDASEVAAGLAYMADKFLSVVPEKNKHSIVSGINLHDFAQDLIAKRTAGELEPLPSDQTISGKMDITAQDRVRQELISTAYNVANLSLGQVADISLEVFLRTNDFTALHAVTASHAARLVLPFVGDKDAFVRELFAGIVTAVLTIPGKQFRRDAFNPKEPLSPEALSHRGRVSTDSHDIKFVYSCLEEFKSYGDIRYLAAAELRLDGW